MPAIDRFVRRVWLLPAAAVLPQLPLVALAFGLRHVGLTRAAALPAAVFEAAVTTSIVVGPTLLLALLYLRRAGRIAADQPGVRRATVWALVGTFQFGLLLLFAILYRYF